MRVVIVHEEGALAAINKLITQSLCRLFPDAEVVPVGSRDSRGADRPRIARQRLSCAPLDDADLVISTSCRAANLAQVRPGTLHVCYVAELETGSDSSFFPRSPSCNSHVSLAEFPRMMAAAGLGGLADDFGDPWGRFPRKGVTHFLAGSGRVARYLRQETGRPVKIISPPVAIEKFRPGRQRRSGDYLLIARAGERVSLDLAIEACRVARRRLVVLTDEPTVAAYQGRGFAHVRFLSAVSDEDVRRQMSGCRAVLCPSETDFDSSVVEAQACGTAVIVSSRSGVAETVIDAEGEGQGTGLFFDEPVPESLASAMFELERRPQKFSAALAWAHARKFSVERFEREMSWFLEAVRTANPIATKQWPYGDISRPAA